MKQWRIALLCSILLGLLAPSFSHAQEGGEEEKTPTPPAPWVCPEGFTDQTLRVYNWSTYIAEDTIPNFEALCGVKVVYDLFESNEDMVERLETGEQHYDVIVPSDYVVTALAEDGLLMPLDHSKIPNLVNLNPALLNAPFDPENVYSVPYQWGTTGLGYNVTEVGEEITSWEQVFAYEGRVAWLDDPRDMLGIALNRLGYDPNTVNADEIAEATAFLLASSANVRAIADDDGQVLLEQGKVDMAIEYSGDIFQLISDCECDDYRYVIPSEGTVIWMDNLVIPADAPNPDLAHIFIDYLLHPQVGADISNTTAYASPNQAAIDLGLIDEEYLNNSAIYPDETLSANLFWITENPENEALVTAAWDEISLAVEGE